MNPTNSKNNSKNNDVYVSLEFTPNPNTLKYSVNRTLLEKGAFNFAQKSEADGRSPLAAKLFQINGVAGVMIGKDFVTITKSESGDWDIVHKSSVATLQDHLGKNEAVLYQAALEEKEGDHKGGNTDLENKIREILDRDIRPAVAMDGGDITFERFDNGVVYLYLQGSCSGCPSSTMTLKMGIETRLRDAIPEVREVVAV